MAPDLERQSLTSCVSSSFVEITNEVWAATNLSEFRMSLPPPSTGILSAQPGLDTCTEDAEAFYADSAAHGYLHLDALFVFRAVGFTAQTFDRRARVHGHSLKVGAGKLSCYCAARRGCKGVAQPNYH